VFDEEDVRRRAHQLADFVEDARQAYQIDAPIALGYSNGANIAAAVMLLRPKALAGAILLRAMAPLSNERVTQGLGGKAALIISGALDPIAPPVAATRLAMLLQSAGAEVQRRTLTRGHELSSEDVLVARDWLSERSLMEPQSVRR
jgi:phospholipase/carboxylesterase